MGRLYPALLGPFLVLGLAKTAGDLRRRRRDEATVLLAVTAAFTLPMLPTSRVHIGRLVFALPFPLLTIAVGADWAGRRQGALPRGGRSATRWRVALSVVAPPTIAGALLGAMAWSAWGEERALPAPGRDEQLRRGLAAAAPRVTRAGGGVLVASGARDADNEAIAVAGPRLSRSDVYRFVDARGLAGGGDRAADPSDPAVYYGGLGDRATMERVPGRCRLVFLVAPELAARFSGSASPLPEECRAQVRFASLPP